MQSPDTIPQCVEASLHITGSAQLHCFVVKLHVTIPLLQYNDHPAVVPLRDKVDTDIIRNMTSSIQIRSEFNIFASVYSFYGYACIADLLYTFLVLLLFYNVFDPWTKAVRDGNGKSWTPGRMHFLNV